jgi:transcriptional regulator with XRE-family HTH domain
MRYTQAIGIRLNEILKERNLTQTELARRSEISRMTINGIIKGRATIVTFEILILICAALEITLTEFFKSSIFEEKLEIVKKQNGRRISFY